MTARRMAGKATEAWLKIEGDTGITKTPSGAASRPRYLLDHKRQHPNSPWPRWINVERERIRLQKCLMEIATLRREGLALYTEYSMVNT